MYKVSNYKVDNVDELISFMKRYPLAFISGIDLNGNFVGTHIPLTVEKRDGQLFLVGHMMKQTDHYQAMKNNTKVFTVFNGPNGYISASWGTNKSKGSTWNYMTTHVNGNISFFEGERLISLMRNFTLEHENNDRNSHTIFDNLPKSYKDKLMTHIIGFEIKIEKIEGVFKLSQDVNEETYTNILNELNKKGSMDKLLGDEMKNRREKLFS